MVLLIGIFEKKKVAVTILNYKWNFNLEGNTIDHFLETTWGKKALMNYVSTISHKKEEIWMKLLYTQRKDKISEGLRKMWDF